MYKYRVLFFDLDGTLVDSLSSGIASLTAVAESLGHETAPGHIAHMKAHWGSSIKKLISCWGDIDVEPFRAGWNKDEREFPSPLFPGMHEALAALKAHMNLGVYTGRKITQGLAILASHNLRNTFRIVRTQDHVKNLKPDPEAFDTLALGLARAGISRREIAYVGDTIEYDFDCAQAADIDFFATIESGHITAEQFLKAGVPESRILQSVRDLPGVLGIKR